MLILSQVRRSTKSTMMSPTEAESRCTGKGSIRTVTLAKTSPSTSKVAEEFLEPTVISTYLVTSLGFFFHDSVQPKIQIGLKPTLSCIMEFHG